MALKEYKKELNPSQKYDNAISVFANNYVLQKPKHNCKKCHGKGYIGILSKTIYSWSKVYLNKEGDISLCNCIFVNGKPSYIC